MKRWRRSASVNPSTTVTPQCVTVVSVVVESDVATWLFSTNIFVINTIEDLLINGFEPFQVLGNEGPSLSVQYNNSSAPGDPWDATAAIGDIDFEGGSPLCPGQTGDVT